ncbi:MAG: hypothetical protein SGPRY_010104 [Prymnesium sp.]
MRQRPELSVTVEEPSCSLAGPSPGPLRSAKRSSRAARRSPYQRGSRTALPPIPGVAKAEKELPQPPSRPGKEITSLGLSSVAITGGGALFARMRSKNVRYPNPLDSLPRKAAQPCLQPSARIVGAGSVPLWIESSGAFHPKYFPGHLSDACGEGAADKGRASSQVDEAKMIQMLRSYDNPSHQRRFSTTELHENALELMDSIELHQLKLKFRIAMEAAGRPIHVGSERTSQIRVTLATETNDRSIGKPRKLTLCRTHPLQLPTFKLFIRQLRVIDEPRPDDSFIATRLFKALDENCKGAPPAGLFEL